MVVPSFFFFSKTGVCMNLELVSAGHGLVDKPERVTLCPANHTVEATNVYDLRVLRVPLKSHYVSA